MEKSRRKKQPLFATVMKEDLKLDDDAKKNGYIHL